MTRDRTTGLITLILGIAVAIGTMGLPDSKMAGDIGPKAFPAIAAGALVICGLGLLITGRKKAEATYSKEQLRRLGTIAGIVLAYLVLMGIVGFLIPTVAVLFILSAMFARGKSIPWWHSAIFAVVFTAAMYFCFTNLLGMKLPESIF